MELLEALEFRLGRYNELYQPAFKDIDLYRRVNGVCRIHLCNRYRYKGNTLGGSGKRLPLHHHDCNLAGRRATDLPWHHW